jgi:hypothetical protein
MTYLKLQIDNLSSGRQAITSSKSIRKIDLTPGRVPMGHASWPSLASASDGHYVCQLTLLVAAEIGRLARGSPAAGIAMENPASTDSCEFVQQALESKSS